MKKRKSIKQLKNELWRLVSLYIRSHGSNCYTCGKNLPDIRDRQGGHFWSRGGHDSVRFDLRNVRIQCLSCNNFKSGNLAEYAVKLRAEIGDKEFNDLAELAHKIVKRDRTWYEAQIDNLKIALTCNERL